MKRRSPTRRFFKRVGILVSGLLTLLWINSAFIGPLVAWRGNNRMAKATLGGGRIEFNWSTTNEPGTGEFDGVLASLMDRTWPYRLGLTLPDYRTWSGASAPTPVFGLTAPKPRLQPPFSLVLPFWTLLLVVGVPTLILWYRDRPPPAGYCVKCGYDLTGNTSGICPECGQPVRAPDAERAAAVSRALPRWWRPVMVLTITAFVVSGAVCLASYVWPIELRSGPPGSDCRYDANREAWSAEPAGNLLDWATKPGFSSSTGHRHTLIALHRARLRVAHLDTESNAFLGRPRYEPLFVFVWEAFHSCANTVPIGHVPWSFAGFAACLLGYAVVHRRTHARPNWRVRLHWVAKWLALTGTTGVVAVCLVSVFYVTEYSRPWDDQKYRLSVTLESGAVRTTVTEVGLPPPPALVGPWAFQPPAWPPSPSPNEDDEWHCSRTALGLDTLILWPSYGKITDPNRNSEWSVTVPLWIPLFIAAFVTALLWYTARRPRPSSEARADA